jgi:hypothetical protein
MSGKVVFLMRGLPSCGKSYTARQLAGSDGIVLETDEYFLSQVGDDPAHYDYRPESLPAARRWNFERFQAAIAAGTSPIVVDRGNGLNVESQEYAVYAVEHGYRVELAEPTSPWWQEIRILLSSPQDNGPLLDDWSHKLAALSARTHRVPQSTIRRWMAAWRHHLTVEDILKFGQQARPTTATVANDWYFANLVAADGAPPETITERKQ